VAVPTSHSRGSRIGHAAGLATPSAADAGARLGARVPHQAPGFAARVHGCQGVYHHPVARGSA